MHKTPMNPEVQAALAALAQDNSAELYKKGKMKGAGLPPFSLCSMPLGGFYSPKMELVNIKTGAVNVLNLMPLDPNLTRQLQDPKL